MDLTPILPLLNQNGPAVLVTVLVLLGIQWWRNRNNPTPTPGPSPIPGPGPAPLPGPTPAPDTPSEPKRALRDLLDWLLARRAAPVMSRGALPPDPTEEEYLRLIGAEITKQLPPEK